jgi:NDP-sugar pyrophosphorylase family protein
VKKTPAKKISDVRAVILAGGKGTRLRPFTAVFPKPLVPLGNKPVLEILLRQLQSNGLRDVTICIGYLGELIRAVCGDGSRFGLRIDYVHEAEPLGTAGPLSLVPNLTDPFIVMNGDLLTTLNFKSLIRFHQRERADFTVGVFPREVKIDFGVIDCDANGAFRGYREKPTYHHDVSMGVNVIGFDARKHITPGKRLDMPDLVLKIDAAGGLVKCYRETCRWLDIGRLEDYAQAQEEFTENEKAFLNGNHKADGMGNGSRRVLGRTSRPVSAKLK